MKFWQREKQLVFGAELISIQLALRATMRPLFMLVLLPRVGDAEAIITVC